MLIIVRIFAHVRRPRYGEEMDTGSSAAHEIGLHTAAETSLAVFSSIKKPLQLNEVHPVYLLKYTPPRVLISSIK